MLIFYRICPEFVWLETVDIVLENLPFALMNRLNQTEFAVFKLWTIYFQRISCQIISKYVSRQVSIKQMGKIA